MSLTRLIYFSEWDRSASLDLDDLLRKCRKNNMAVDVSGFLFFDGLYFVQALEGERYHVSNTYHRIVTDIRHKNLILITSMEVRSRLFAGWSMGLHQGANVSTRQALLSAFSLSALNPAEITVEDTQFFLQTLARKLQNTGVQTLKE